MSTVLPFPEGSVESLARLLGECGSGSDINRVLDRRGLQDRSGESTKWRRLYWIFLDVQCRDRSANRILDFIQSFLAPARFVGRNDEFETHRIELNTVLAFAGLEYGPDGAFRKRQAARTLSEAERRANSIKAKVQGRRIHPEVLKSPESPAPAAALGGRWILQAAPGGAPEPRLVLRLRQRADPRRPAPAPADHRRRVHAGVPQH